MQNFLFGKGDREPILEECEELAKEIIENHVVIQVLLAFPKLSFEERKSFTLVFCTLLNRDHYKFSSSYMTSLEGCDILQCIITCCGEQSLSINAGTMLRECIKIRSIHQLLLSRPSLIEPLFTQYAFDPNFDVCSDVFQSIRDLLRKNKQIVSSALRPSKPLYNQLFSWIYALLESENYVITRIVLHLLGEFLIDKSNFEIMLHFIKSEENLKIFMILLCSQYPSIQFDAFNVFKIFVANPDKSAEVRRILVSNRQALVEFIGSLLPEKEENDDVFAEEKKLVVNVLHKMDDE